MRHGPLSPLFRAMNENTPPSDQQAVEIYQAKLDHMSTLLLAGEVEAAADILFLPNTMRTAQSEQVFETREEIIDQIKKVCSFLQSNGVTHYVRLVTHSAYLSAGFIKGLHTTHILRNATYVVAPYDCTGFMQQRDDVWGFTQLDTMLGNRYFPIVNPTPLDDSRQTFDAEYTEDARSGDQAAVEIYQDYLDALTATNLADDFEGWCNHCFFPHTVHTTAMDKTIKTPEGIRPFFEMLTAMIREKGITSFRRIAETASFISGDRIVGYHTGNLNRGEEVIIGPIKSRMVIQKTDAGGWAMTSVTNSVLDQSIQGGFENPTNSIPTLREIDKRNRDFINRYK